MRLQVVLLVLVSSIHQLIAFRVVLTATKEIKLRDSTQESVHTTNQSPHAKGNDKQLAKALMHSSSEVPKTADAGGEVAHTTNHSAHVEGNRHDKELAQALMHRSSKVLLTADAGVDSSSALLEHTVSGKGKKETVCCGKFHTPQYQATELHITSVKKKKGKCHRWWWEGVASALNFDSHNQNLDRAVRAGYTQFHGCCKRIKDGGTDTTDACAGNPAIQIPPDVNTMVYDDVFEMWLCAVSACMNGITSQGSHRTPDLAMKAHVGRVNAGPREFRKKISPLLARISEYLGKFADQEFAHADEQAVSAPINSTHPKIAPSKEETQARIQEWAKQVNLDHVDEILSLEFVNQRKFTDKEKAFALLKVWESAMKMQSNKIDSWSSSVSSLLDKLQIPK